MAGKTFDEFKAEFTHESIPAINPTMEDYRRAGTMAGTKGAEKFVGHCLTSNVLPTSNGVEAYYTAAIVSSCERMRSKGATEENLTAWTAAYLAALKAGVPGRDA